MIILERKYYVLIRRHRQPRLNGDTRRRNKRQQKKLHKKDIVRFKPSICEVLAKREIQLAMYKRISDELLRAAMNGGAS